MILFTSTRNQLPVVLPCTFKHTDRAYGTSICTHSLIPATCLCLAGSICICSSGPFRSSKEEDGWDHRVYLRMLPVPRSQHGTLGTLSTCPLPPVLFLPLSSPITHWVFDPSLHPAEVPVIWVQELLFWTCCFFLSMLPATMALVGSAAILLSRLLITVWCGSWDSCCTWPFPRVNELTWNTP